MPECEGRSENGSLDEALKKAIEQALKASTHSDRMVSYTIKKISGVKGGLAGFNRTLVVIDAELHQGRRESAWI